MEAIIGIIAFICAVWVIYEVWAVNTGLSTVAKVIWTISALIFNIITAIVYYFIHKR